MSIRKNEAPYDEKMITPDWMGQLVIRRDTNEHVVKQYSDGDLTDQLLKEKCDEFKNDVIINKQVPNTRNRHDIQMYSNSRFKANQVHTKRAFFEQMIKKHGSKVRNPELVSSIIKNGVLVKDMFDDEFIGKSVTVAERQFTIKQHSKYGPMIYEKVGDKYINARNDEIRKKLLSNKETSLKAVLKQVKAGAISIESPDDPKYLNRFKAMEPLHVAEQIKFDRKQNKYVTKQRVCLDSTCQNAVMRQRPFSQENATIFNRYIQPEAKTGFSMDLTSAFLNVKTADELSDMLGSHIPHFYIKGRSILFGLTLSPFFYDIIMQFLELEFADLIEELDLSKLIVAIFRYVDDILVLLSGRFPEGSIPRLLKVFAARLMQMGVTLSAEKSQFTVSSNILFLGIMTDLNNRQFSVDQEMSYKLKERIIDFFPNAEVTIDQLNGDWNNLKGKEKITWSHRKLQQLAGVIIWISHCMDLKMIAAACMFLAKYPDTRDPTTFEVARSELQKIWDYMTNIGILNEKMKRRPIIIKIDESEFLQTGRKRHRSGFVKKPIKRSNFERNVKSWTHHNTGDDLGKLNYTENISTISQIEDMAEISCHLLSTEEKFKFNKKFVAFQNMIQAAIRKDGANAISIIVNSETLSKYIRGMSKQKWKLRKLVTMLAEFLAKKFKLNSHIIVYTGSDAHAEPKNCLKSFKTKNLTADINWTKSWLFANEERFKSGPNSPECIWIIKIPSYRTIYVQRKANEEKMMLPFIDKLPDEWPTARTIVLISEDIKFILHCLSRIWFQLLTLRPEEIRKKAVSKLWIITKTKRVRKKVALFYHRCATIDIATTVMDGQTWAKMTIIPRMAGGHFIADPTALHYSQE